jgi:hypothetical protein
MRVTAELPKGLAGFVYDDGGRAAAGFKGEADDCVCRAVAIATGRPYREVYDELNYFCQYERLSRREETEESVFKGKVASSSRTGVRKPTSRAYLESLGWVWTPTMKIGSGCRVHLRTDELPPGRLVVQVSKHVVAVIDGVIRDTHDCSRDGTRCVYGYWQPPAR